MIPDVRPGARGHSLSECWDSSQLLEISDAASRLMLGPKAATSRRTPKLFLECWDSSQLLDFLADGQPKRPKAATSRRSPTIMSSGPSHFATTQWSLVLHAGQRADVQRDRALATLCERYWYPLYAYARRRTGDIGQAQDLTQDFFARLLEKGTLEFATPERGRFRSFLLTAMKNFLASAHEKDQAQKRGGSHKLLPLDFDAGESK